MTTIITRLYQDEQTANGVAKSLLDNHFRSNMLDVVAGANNVDAAMTDAGVTRDSKEAYGQGIRKGNALLVVRAPFGGAQKAELIVDQTPSLAGGSAYVSTDMSAQYQNSILSDHPRFMSSGMYPSLSRGRSMIATLFGKPLMKKKVNLNNALYRGTKFWANFPIPHLKDKKRNIETSIYRGTKFWANWPIAHLTNRERDPSLY